MHDPYDKGIDSCTKWGGAAGSPRGPIRVQKLVKLGQTSKMSNYSETTMPRA